MMKDLDRLVHKKGNLKNGDPEWKIIDEIADQTARSIIDSGFSNEWQNTIGALVLTTTPKLEGTRRSTCRQLKTGIKVSIKVSTRTPIRVDTSVEQFDPTQGTPIVLWNSLLNAFETVLPRDYNLNDFPKPFCTPIGLVVIPKGVSDVVYPEGYPNKGKDIVMSLKWMDHYHPETGSDTPVTMQSNCYFTWNDTVTPYYPSRPVVSNNVTQASTLSRTRSMVMSGIYEQPELEDSYEPEDSGIMRVAALDESGIPEDPSVGRYYPYFPQDVLVNGPEQPIYSQACPYTQYQAAPYCPCPYLLVEGRFEANPAYYLPWNEASPSCTSDFTGKVSTDLLTAWSKEHSQMYKNWETDETIPDPIGEENRGAQHCMCCSRYHTAGTKPRDWWMPGFGEIGFTTAFVGKHTEAIQTINNVYGSSYSPMQYDGNYINSLTSYGNMHSMYIGYNDGIVRALSGITRAAVKAFTYID